VHSFSPPIRPILYFYSSCCNCYLTLLYLPAHQHTINTPFNTMHSIVQCALFHAQMGCRRWCSMVVDGVRCCQSGATPPTPNLPTLHTYRDDSTQCWYEQCVQCASVTVFFIFGLSFHLSLLIWFGFCLAFPSLSSLSLISTTPTTTTTVHCDY